MLKTALHANSMPHIWKLADIVTIRKPNKNIDNDTSYKPISQLSVIADTGVESSSLYNSKHTKQTHATWVQNTTLYSDGTAHIKQHCSKDVQPNSSRCVNNHCSTPYKKAFDTINIHKLFRKVLQTKIPGTIIKLIANKRDAKSTQHT